MIVRTFEHRHEGPAMASRDDRDIEPDRTPAVGKVSLVEQVYGNVQAVHADDRDDRSDAEHTRVAATAATGGPGGELPYRQIIQRCFGRHDISQIRAHTDDRARAGAQAMGAEAFATGHHVVFGAQPSLHTAAHEAAHVVQQRAGVQLKGGVGEAGDAHERHADAVADCVVRGQSAEALLDHYAPGAGARGAQVQMMLLVKDQDSGKLRKLKPKEKAKQGDQVIDTDKLPPEALNALLAELETHAKALAGEIRKERAQKKPTGALTDIAQVFGVAAELEALETAKGAKKPLDKAAIKRIADKLSAAHVLLHSVEIPDEATLYRDTIAAYTRRLHALDDKVKLSYKDGDEGLAVGVQIGVNERAGYRADVAQDGVWGGLAEAEVAAQRIRRQITIFRLDHQNTYRRVMVVGQGQTTSHNLLHLGNHYVAIPARIVDGAVATPQDGRIETEPDGNCMYEAIQICLRGHKPTPEQRTRFIAGIRAQVSAGMTPDAVDTSIIAILAQGDRAGLGPNMRRLVQDRRAEARVEQLDEEALTRITGRFEGLKGSKKLDHADKARSYLAERGKDAHSKQTIDALAALEDSLAAAEMALAARDWNVDPSQTELPMDWWGAVKTALGDKVLAKSEKVFTPLVARVVDFNRKAKESEVSVAARLRELDYIEEAFKNLEAPGGPLDVKDAAHEQARVAVYGFQTVELRKVRANLVRLYQLAEGSAYRTMQPGNRPELHYDVYAEGEDEGQGQRTTPELGDLSKKEEGLVDKEFKPKTPKDKQEALSAVALQRAYPKLFSEISKAPKYTKLKQNVEYYDNLGHPWDQIGGHSHTKGSEAAIAMAIAVKDHLDNKPYPPKGTKDEDADKVELLDCGVVLDCTYLDHNDYVRMWSHMIQYIAAADLRARVVEINVPFGKGDHKDDYSKRKSEKTNTTVLDSCRAGKVEADEADKIYNVSAAEVAKYISTIKTDASAIKKGTSAKGNQAHPVYRNHGGFLPNMGSYFLEFYASDCAGLPNGTDVRIVYDQPNEIFYLTGTHYRPFMSPYSNVLRNPFYRIVE
jgi:hypothetical protein